MGRWPPFRPASVDAACLISTWSFWPLAEALEAVPALAALVRQVLIIVDNNFVAPDEARAVREALAAQGYLTVTPAAEQSTCYVLRR